MQTFNEYLLEYFINSEHYNGDKRALPDTFETWLGYLEPEEWLRYGDMYALKLVRETNEEYICSLDQIRKTLRGEK